MLKISIVEDLEEIRETLKAKIGDTADFQILNTYPDAEQALPGLLLHKPDIVLMDIGLPGMSGVECMMRVKAHASDIRFLMFTIFDNDENVFEALKAGADGYILKREPMPRIIESLREVFRDGAPMSRAIARKVLTSFQEVKPSAPTTEILTPRQVEILQQISKGLPYKLIGHQLQITEGTVKQHIHQIYKKLQVNNRTEATNKYFGRLE